MASRRILVLLAHPVLERSRVNRRLADAARAVASVTVHDLYEEYPSMRIAVRREQETLAGHDVLVFQHPFYWYQPPAILKEWQDLVLEHNWAYGSKGHHLDGKITMNAVSTGGPAHAYVTGGPNLFTVRQLLAPYEQTANRCRMRFLAPFIVHSALRVESDDDVRAHTDDYRRLLEALRDDALDLDAAASVDCINAPLPAVLRAREATP